MTNQSNELDRSIGFMMGTTYHKLSALLQGRLKEYGITPEQWSVLYQVNRDDGLIQKEIAELTAKDKPTTTRILEHLEQKGLINKRIGENDRRSFAVYITDKGQKLIQETTPIERQVTVEIKQCISEEEYEGLISLLLRINNHVNKLTERE